MKIASRYLLPVELLTAAVMVSWGVSGWSGGAGLWSMLAAQGMNAEWGLVLCGLGTVQFCVAAFELARGRRWESRPLLFSVSLRFWLAFFATAAWFYACFLVLTMPGAPGMFSLAMQAPMALACSMWIAYDNRKVACVLDPGVPTQALQARIRREREILRGWSAEEEPLVRGPH